MKRSAVVAAVLAFALALAIGACRSVLGIEEIDLIDGGPDAAGAEAATTDASDDAAPGTDAGFDATLPPSLAACQGEGKNCRPCCHAGTALNTALDIDIASKCLCDSNNATDSCYDLCKDSVCVGHPAPQPDPDGGPSCGPCIDEQLISKTGICGKVVDDPQCAPGTDCWYAVECMQTCN